MKQVEINITKKAIFAHLKKNEPMSYVLPLEEDGSCSICRKYICKNKKILQDLDEQGNIKIFCSDNCWLQNFTFNPFI